MTPEQAKALRESATGIIAHEKSLEREKEKLEAELGKVGRNARQAVMMADEATREGDADKAADFGETAGVLAERMVEIETRVARIDIELIEARQASAEAMSMASDSAIRRTQAQAKSAEMRAEMRRAQMAEAGLEATGTPSYDEVKDKIAMKVARAEAEAELADADGSLTLQAHTERIEEAAKQAKARAKLAELRSSMGIATSDFDDAPDAGGPDESE